MAFNGRFLVNISQFASRLGVESESLLSLSNKPFEELCNEDCIVENSEYNAVIEKAVYDSNDPLFGLHAGENMSLSAAGLIAQITQSSETIKQALEYCCEFANLGCSVLPMTLIEEEGYYKVSIIPDENWKNESELAFRHTADGVMAFTVREFHSLTQMKYYPIKVNLPWPKRYEKEYARIFNTHVAFNSDDLSIELNKHHVESKIMTSDYALLRILVAHAQEKSESLALNKDFTSLVKQSVINLVKPEFPTITQVAANLNISTRTLQRKLKNEGVKFNIMIDQLKLEFALTYLNKPDLSISEVAYLLGYADPSSFIRFFKKCSGVTPLAYKRAL